MMRARLRTVHVAGKNAWLADAHPDDQLFITFLRRWLDGPCGQAEIWNALAVSLDRVRAVDVLRAFEQLLRQVAIAARRKLERHGSACPCLGEDEALLAGMVRAAGRGDTETAWAIAAGMLHEPELPAVIEAAMRLGQLMDGLGAGSVQASGSRITLH